MVGLIASIGTGLLLLNMAVVGCFCLLNRQQRSERSLRSLPPSSAMSASASVSIGEATLKQILDEEAMAAAAAAAAARPDASSSRCCSSASVDSVIDLTLATSPALQHRPQRYPHMSTCPSSGQLFSHAHHRSSSAYTMPRPLDSLSMFHEITV